MSAGAEDYPEDSRGCIIKIDENNGVIYHHKDHATHQPVVRSYSDGIKVGCTFITTDALDRIYRWQKEYLEGKASKTWQG